MGAAGWDRLAGVLAAATGVDADRLAAAADAEGVDPTLFVERAVTARIEKAEAVIAVAREFENTEPGPGLPPGVSEDTALMIGENAMGFLEDHCAGVPTIEAAAAAYVDAAWDAGVRVDEVAARSWAMDVYGRMVAA